jgi:hypothetical protein
MAFTAFDEDGRMFVVEMNDYLDEANNLSDK